MTANSRLSDRWPQGLIGIGVGFLAGVGLSAVTIDHGKFSATGRLYMAIGIIAIVIGGVGYTIVHRKEWSKKAKNDGQQTR
jgi:hypothetical protein